MKISVVKDDGLVYVDGQAHGVKLDDLPDYIHAIQWDSAKKTGHIEYKADSRGIHQSNAALVDFSQYEYLIDRWRIVKKEKDDAAEAQRKREEAVLEGNQREMIQQRGELAKTRKAVKRPSKPK